MMEGNKHNSIFYFLQVYRGAKTPDFYPGGGHSMFFIDL